MQGCSFFRAVVLVQEEYSDKDAGHNALWNSNTTLTKPLPQYPHAQYPHAQYPHAQYPHAQYSTLMHSTLMHSQGF